MSRYFTTLTLGYIQSTICLTSTPITFSAWINLNSVNLALDSYIVSVVDQDEASNSDYHALLIDTAGAYQGRVYAQTYQSGVGTYTAYMTAVITPEKWHHVCGVFAAANDRRVYLDGGNKATNASSATPAGLSHTTIGGLGSSSALSIGGAICEVGIWRKALTDHEILLLSRGYNPQLIQPNSLYMYLPLLGSDADIVGNHQFRPHFFSNRGRPIWTDDHPDKIWYMPSDPLIMSADEQRQEGKKFKRPKKPRPYPPPNPPAGPSPKIKHVLGGRPFWRF